MAKEYDIERLTGRCVQCEAELAPNTEFVATVIDSDEQLLRQDYCISCWSSRERDESRMLGTWRSRVPEPRQKRKLLVDDNVIASFFERLADSDDPTKVNFRFVLALVLMRKKLLIYDRLERRPDGSEVWLMHFKGSEQPHEVLDPKMDEEKIVEVSQQLNQIMEVDTE